MARPKGIPHTEEFKRQQAERSRGRVYNETGHVLTRKEISRRWREAHPGYYTADARRHRRKSSDASYRRTEEYRAAQKKYRVSEKYRTTQREYSLRSQYGINLIDFEKLVESQKGVCPICLESLGYDKGQNNHRGLAVDHDHVTGKIRGILHHLCNVAIGCLKDDSMAARRAAEYLEKHQMILTHAE